MRAPGSRFSASVGKVVAIRVEVPAISRGVMVSRCPALSCTGMRFFSRPVRIFGPCKSPRMQIGLPSSRRDLAHHFDQLELFRMGAVGEVEPGHIEAGADQFAENRFRGYRKGPAWRQSWPGGVGSAGRVLLGSIRVKLIRPPYCVTGDGSDTRLSSISILRVLATVEG